MNDTSSEDRDTSEERADQADANQAEEDKDAAQGRDDEDVEATMREVEENPPENLEDWPQGKAKYETYGGPEGQHGYHEGPEQKLGPSSLRHHEGGEVEIEGEKVEDPSEYKGEPIPGGPTDPNAPKQPAERELQKQQDGDGEDDDEEG